MALPNLRTIRAPRGTELSAKSWLTEAPLRMLMNNLDPEVAERPGELVVYGGMGRAARDWDSFDRIVAALRRLEGDQTLLVQSGKPVGVFRTHADAPRVLIANSNLVPHWATWEHFNELDRKGLMMYGQMTAGSWIYIGSQGIIQGPTKPSSRWAAGTMAATWRAMDFHRRAGRHGRRPAACRDHGRRVAAGGRVPAEPIEMRLKTGYLDRQARDLDEALAIIERACRDENAGLRWPARQCGRVAAGTRCAAACGRTSVTDQTSAHDPANGYLPKGWTVAEWESRRESPQRRDRGGARIDRRTRAGDAGVSPHGHPDVRLRQQHPPGGERGRRGGRVRLPGFRSGLYPPAVLPRHRPLPLGRTIRRSRGHLQDRRQGKGIAARQRASAPLAGHGAQRIRFQGLPARICWVGLGDRHRLGLAFNEMVARGELSAPIVIGRDHLDAGSVASPNRETEAMRDGSDAVSDWPMLNALLNCASGATWVSIHHGGGVGIGYSQHAGMVVVCDGTTEAARRIERVLWNDPATGVMRHADAGYEDALACAGSIGWTCRGYLGPVDK